MHLTFLDLLAFFLFLIFVIGVSIYASGKEETGEDYFLAGRKLTWWLVGLSLIASNISTEQIVGMSGGGVKTAGMAIASYEWIAALALVFVGVVLLPVFLKLGIYTMPEFLEHRYGPVPRTLMSVFVLIVYVSVLIVSVLYSGAILFEELVGLPFYLSIWAIGLVAGGYTIYGGLKAVVWSDLIQGIALLLGGVFVAYLAFYQVGGVGEFMRANEDKLHMVLPSSHDELPWTALLLGIWIPNFYYWGTNQFITQRALGARNLIEAQKGVIFAAVLKLLIPFIVVFPGIIAFQLYPEQIGASGDNAYPILMNNLLPGYGFRGVMFAALFGAVMSSLDSMLNAASTLFSIDIYKRYINPDPEQKKMVRIGRISTGVFVVLACLMAPLPRLVEGVFKYIQMLQGFISPGILAVFLVGIASRRSSSSAAVTGLLMNIPTYGLLRYFYPDMAFLNHMAITFSAIILIMFLIRLIDPLDEPVEFENKSDLDLTPDPYVTLSGSLIVLATIGLYVVFW